MWHINLKHITFYTPPCLHPRLVEATGWAAEDGRNTWMISRSSPADSEFIQYSQYMGIQINWFSRHLINKLYCPKTSFRGTVSRNLFWIYFSVLHYWLLIHPLKRVWILISTIKCAKYSSKNRHYLAKLNEARGSDRADSQGQSNLEQLPLEKYEIIDNMSGNSRLLLKTRKVWEVLVEY